MIQEVAFRMLLFAGMMHNAGYPHYALAQQGLSNLWMGGYESVEPHPLLGGVNVDFLSGGAIISTTERGIDFSRTNSNLTDTAGNLLFSTNGAYIANATGDTMLSGAGLNPSPYVDQYAEGTNNSQACLILPKPDDPNIFYLIHSTVDDPANNYNVQFLYLTTIDIRLDAGLGGVVGKNVVLIDDALNIGKITAVRHANGRDWWVFCHKANSNIYYRLRVTPEGVYMDGTQAIGIYRPNDVGQVCFSSDGSKFAYYGSVLSGDLEIFDFDRCTGLFSNPVTAPIPDANIMGGVAFSPNGHFVYVTSVLDVYQFDTETADFAGSMVHIAHWDSTYSPSPPFATLFDIAQLAPDGKIYIGTGNSTLRLHVIHNPDEPGLACNMEQHGIELPRYYMNSLPNHPNYHLGALAGSVCDTLGLGVREQILQLTVRAYPNPSNGAFTLSYPAQPTVGELEVRDVAGRVVLRQRIPQWSTIHEVDLQGQALGMYQCSLQWGKETMTTRVILTEG